MSVELLPKYQLGYVLPVPVADGVFHAFYSVCGPRLSIVGYPSHLSAFSRADGTAALDASRDAIEFLARREVDRIVIGGLPVTTAPPPEYVKRFCASASDEFGITVTSDAAETVDAVKSLGATSVALATKWSDDVVSGVEEYLGSEGVSVTYRTSHVHTASEVLDIRPVDGYQIALDLGRSAAPAKTSADAVVLGGGAWFAVPALHEIEADIGMPVVNNVAATLWSALRDARREPVAGSWGVLLEQLSA